MASSSRPNSPISDNTSAGVLVDNWWHNVPPKKSRTSTRAKNKLPHTSLHGPRCLLTGETGPSSAIERCHLVDRSISDNKRRNLQYAWGRKFDIDSRWNLFYLMAHMHRAFDAHLGDNGKVPPGWILVPELNLVTEIFTKMLDERERRKAHGIRGPWPDFRSKSWFPARKGGYKYMFVPLTFLDENVVVVRHEWREDSPSSPITIRLYRPPLYEDFPLLECHVHPYVVIMNAYPKLRDNITKLPADIINDVMGKLVFIYHTWENTWKDADTPPPLTPSTTSHGSSRNGTRARRPGTGQSDLSSEDHMAAGGPKASQDESARSGSSSGGRNAYERSGASYGHSRSPLSAVSSDDSVPCQGDTKAPAPTRSFIQVQESLAEDQRIPNDLIEWILGVEAAREHDQLAALSNDPPDLGFYATEKARTPLTEDWHGWTSEYAPWYVLLPKNRGLLSSNDWVEVKNYPPLTRGLDKYE